MSRVGLVLGAGGIVGQAYHAGVLQAFSEQGFDPARSEIVIGTSAGSLVGGLLRSGMSVADLVSGRYRRGEVDSRASEVAQEAHAMSNARSAARPKLGRARLGSRLAGLLPAGRVSPGGIISMVRRVGSDRWPSAPTWICAVRRDGGRRVAFGTSGAPEAPFPAAVAASCAIPGYFTPVRIDGREYMDGGAHSPTNLDLLAGQRLHVALVISPMSFAGSPSIRLDVGPRLLFRGMLAREAFAVRRRGTPVLTVQPGARELEVMGLNAMSPSRWSDVVQVAAETTRQQLARRESASALRRLLG